MVSKLSQISLSKTREHVQQAIKLFQENDKPVPNTLAEAADQVRGIDSLLDTQLARTPQESDEYSNRERFQRALADLQPQTTVGGEKPQNQFAGTSFSATGLYFPADLHTRITKPAVPNKPTGLAFSNQTTHNVSAAEKQVQTEPEKALSNRPLARTGALTVTHPRVLSNLEDYHHLFPPIDKHKAHGILLDAQEANEDPGPLGSTEQTLAKPKMLGTKTIASYVRDHPDAFTADGRAHVDHFLQTGCVPGSAKEIEKTLGPPTKTWVAAKETFHVHHFAMVEVKYSPAHQTAYADGGCCWKYDRAFGVQSQAYQRANWHRKPDFSDEDALYAGFCNQGAEQACMLEEPLWPVEVIQVDGGRTRFTPHDIKGLISLCADDVIDISNIDYVGFRNYGFANPLEPHPHEVHHQIFEKWGLEDRTAFVLDIDPGPPVWNKPFDRGRIWELPNPPAGFDPAKVPTSQGDIKFYRTHLSGKGWRKSERLLTYWIHTANDETETSGWIFGPNTTPNPDFGWRPRSLKPWRGRSQVNPHIRLEDVGQLYAASTRKAPPKQGAHAVTAAAPRSPTPAATTPSPQP